MARSKDEQNKTVEKNQAQKEENNMYKLTRASSVEEYKLVGSFEHLRKTLLQDRYVDRWEKPLAYWALPNDRRLPLAFLGRTVKDLVTTPFEELKATPGIGQKKIHSFVNLLSRATKDHPPAVPFEQVASEEHAPSVTSEKPPVSGKQNGKGKKPEPSVGTQFNADLVSELLWNEWTQTVRDHGVQNEKLGRVIPSLKNLPTVIWHRPLSAYMEHSLQEIRRMRTHGQKRVTAILEVFFTIHESLKHVPPQSHLAVRFVPKFVRRMEPWLYRIAEEENLPAAEEIHENLVEPLVAQIRLDAGDNVGDLIEERLKIQGTPVSVRVQAQRLGVTRARVYQLLDECAKVLDVRWPEGRNLLATLQQRYDLDEGVGRAANLLHAVNHFFYPSKEEEAVTV